MRRSKNLRVPWLIGCRTSLRLSEDAFVERGYIAKKLKRGYHAMSNDVVSVMVNLASDIAEAHRGCVARGYIEKKLKGGIMRCPMNLRVPGLILYRTSMRLNENDLL